MDAKKYKGRLHRSLQAMFIVPLFILGIIITFFSFFTVRSAMYDEVQAELKNTADAVITIYDLLYPGDYHLEGETAFDLYKGNQVITSDYTIIDRLSADASIDITLFYHDTRILTTIRDTDGNRIVGTGADDRIIQEVFWAERPQFYYNATINKVNYFAYYTPLRNSNGAVIGMIYTGKPRSEVDKSVMHAVLPTLVVTLLGVLVVSFVSSTYAHRLTSTLRKIRNFFSKVAAGNLGEQLDPEILRRNDEISEMGYSALYMQRSLRTLIEQDNLTELHNRRFADKRLKQTQMSATIHGTHFVVAIGDIDYFKKVNDTYGHECGDLVLKKVAGVLRKHMAGKGFAARWGGEEFLFLYDGIDLPEAKTETESLLDEIRGLEITYDDQPLHVTMTFGLAEGNVGTNVKELLQKADANLYEGKNQGRNRIIV